MSDHAHSAAQRDSPRSRWACGPRPLPILFALLVLLMLAAPVGLAVQTLRDPLAVIRRPAGTPRIVHDSTYAATTTAGEARVFRDLVMESDAAGTIRVTTSAPPDVTGAPLPFVFILAGLRTGRESLAVVPIHGPNVLVGFEYPYRPADWERGNPLVEAFRIREAILSVPAQVVTAARTLQGFMAIDPTRTSLLGYSFGAHFVPATQRLAMSDEIAFDALALAYAGVDLRALIAQNLKLRPPWLRHVAAFIAAAALHAMEPAHHLPHLRGEFLIIRASRDDRIPPHLSQRLADLTPEPKRMITLDTGHMGPDAMEVTEEVVRLSREWLVVNGHILD